ncbi:MAG: hypothetical protein ABJJ20_15270, partial [Lentilitoribacter sp.]
MDFSRLLHGIPVGLRNELISEYLEIVSNFYEGRWKPSELSAGRFCEIAYSIIHGRAKGSYPDKAAKPNQFDSACRALENQTQLERGLRMLALKILPALYEVRNNRDVGHVGGEVNSNSMDASFAVSASGWILAELVRIFHNISAEEASRMVQKLTEIRTPIVWINGEIRRVLNTDLKVEDQVLLLLASSSAKVSFEDLVEWTETSN